MRHLFLLLVLSFYTSLQAQHTFSIVAVDVETGEIGSAGATCLFFTDAALTISDIVLGVGGIHTQASYTASNQNNARKRMEKGDSPEEIINYLKVNDLGNGSISDRQYGIVDLNDGEPRTAAFTGNTTLDVKGHRLGDNYSIQGNILIDESVLDNMEDAFLNTDGPLCEKLMAVLQAAKIPGADSRCLDEGISSGSAFIRLAKPTDTNSDHGNLWLDISESITNGDFSVDPIDLVQEKFNTFKLTSTSESENSISISPNPTSHIVSFDNTKHQFTQLDILSNDGQRVESKRLNQTSNEANLEHLPDGLYILRFTDKDGASYMSRCLKFTR